MSQVGQWNGQYADSSSHVALDRLSSTLIWSEYRQRSLIVSLSPKSSCCVLLDIS